MTEDWSYPKKGMDTFSDEEFEQVRNLLRVAEAQEIIKEANMQGGADSPRRVQVTLDPNLGARVDKIETMIATMRADYEKWLSEVENRLDDHDADATIEELRYKGVDHAKLAVTIREAYPEYTERELQDAVNRETNRLLAAEISHREEARRKLAQEQAQAELESLKERVAEAMEEAKQEQKARYEKTVSIQLGTSGEAFIEALGTVRACIACGTLVAGGPTRCGYCADRVASVQQDRGPEESEWEPHEIWRNKLDPTMLKLVTFCEWLGTDILGKGVPIEEVTIQHLTIHKLTRLLDGDD